MSILRHVFAVLAICLFTVPTTALAQSWTYDESRSKPGFHFIHYDDKVFLRYHSRWRLSFDTIDSFIRDANLRITFSDGRYQDYNLPREVASISDKSNSFISSLSFAISESTVRDLAKSVTITLTNEGKSRTFSMKGSAKAINRALAELERENSTASSLKNALKQCNTAATFPWDTAVPGNKGVSFSKIDSARAIRACSASVRLAPNDPRQLYQLGRSYDKANDQRAYATVRKAASEYNYPAAQYLLGYFYEAGLFTSKNIDTAASWYRRAADKGSVPALYALGRIIYLDPKLKSQKVQAEKMIMIAAEKNLSTAVAFIGIEISKGNVTNRTPDMAAGFLRKAAKMGRSDASYRLAQMYKSGIGVSQNQSLYEEWMTFAAKQGNKQAKAAGF